MFVINSNQQTLNNQLSVYKILADILLQKYQMQLSTKKSNPANEPCQWSTSAFDQLQICRQNKNREKELIYTMPREILNQGVRVFHPCEWNLNDFQIGRHMGKGKYGHVYLARERKTKMIVALKVISKKQIVNSDIIFQLRRQLEIHSHLKHPNVLKMYGFFWDQKRIYIILDYAPKGQIYKILQKQERFTQYRAANYIYQMIKALKYIHDLKIIHRDIKPENILLSINDEIKLTDFGWSVHVSDKRKKRKTFCGTPDYICPEIANQREYDYRLDLWCLGVLAYEFCAGKAPFSEHIDRRDLIRRIRELRFQYPKFFSAQLKDFISSLMRIRPQQRMDLDIAQSHPWIQKYYFEERKSTEESENELMNFHQDQIQI